MKRGDKMTTYQTINLLLQSRLLLVSLFAVTVSLTKRSSNLSVDKWLECFSLI
jgi:hypothetical protein